MLAHPKDPRVRRIWIIAGIAALGLGLGWIGLRGWNRPSLTVDLIDVGGFNEDLGVWMRFNAVLELRNDGDQTIGLDRITVEPDLDGFNEAYGHAVPFLAPPLLIERQSTTRYTVLVTLLNAAQLQERTYDLVLRVRIETEDGDTIVRDYPAHYDHSRQPSHRRLQLRS